MDTDMDWTWTQTWTGKWSWKPGMGTDIRFPKSIDCRASRKIILFLSLIIYSSIFDQPCKGGPTVNSQDRTASRKGCWYMAARRKHLGPGILEKTGGLWGHDKDGTVGIKEPRTRMLEKDSWDKTAGTTYTAIGQQERTVGMVQAGQEREDRPSRTWQRGAGTGQSRWNNHGVSHDSTYNWDRTNGTWQCLKNEFFAKNSRFSQKFRIFAKISRKCSFNKNLLTFSKMFGKPIFLNIY
jgi:hypothetical protein